VNSRGVPSKSENPPGTQSQEDLSLSLSAPACGKPTTDAISKALECALAQLGTVLAAKDGIEQGAGG
jgi:hypothetical protein